MTENININNLKECIDNELNNQSEYFFNDNYYYNNYHNEKRLIILKENLVKVLEDKNKIIEIKLYVALGCCEYHLQHYSESVHYFIKTVTMCFEQDIDRKDVCKYVIQSFLGLSKIYNRFKKYDTALMLGQYVYDYNESYYNKNSELKADIIFNIVDILNEMQLKINMKIIDKLIERITISSYDDLKYKEKIQLTKAYYYKGLFYEKDSLYENAIECMKEAYKISNDNDKSNISWSILLSLILYSMGNIYIKQNKLEKSAILLKEAELIAKMKTLDGLLKDINNSLMFLYGEKKEYEKAFEIMQKSTFHIEIEERIMNKDVKVKINAQTKNIDLMLDMLEVVKKNEEQQERVSLLELENTTDVLTNIFNRRTLDKMLSKAILEKQPSSLLMIDIDSFKKINDTYGHIIGDKVLKQMGQILYNVCRKEDFLSRYGGEELAVIVINEDINIGIKTAERIRVGVENFKWSDIEKELKVTVSIGIHLNNGKEVTIEQWIAAADSQLYIAKTSGKNKVCYEGVNK